MRISVIPDDPGYPPNGVFDVYLDGRKMTNVYTADDALGEVVVPDTSDAEVTFFDLPTKTLKGDVRIEPKLDGWYFD